jgi:hypothetical protein
MPAAGVSRGNPQRAVTFDAIRNGGIGMFKGGLLWLIGIPIPIIIVLLLLGVL